MSELYGHDRRGLLNKEDPLDPEREVWGAVPILRTKLNRPRLTADLLIRNRLLEHLEDAIDAPLTVITAPAGYGKSVLASSWAERSERNVAWLSLDEDDSDLRLFLTYFVAAIESVLHGACPSTLELTRAPELPRPERIGKYLVNELEGLESPIVLILDDYHRLAPDSPVHNLVTFILSNRPRQCRLVILTRRDPPLPARLLWTDHCTVQIRLQELRFTLGETAEYFKAESGLTLGKSELESLERQFEGWAIGLRLFSLRLRRAEDKVTFIRRFDGAVPHGKKYLLQEVLSGAPAGVRNSLLKSSILDRFCAPLLDDVFSAQVDPLAPVLRGEDFIDLLQQGNYFGIALDPSREWYRYHHFFREFLKHELRKHFEAQEIVTLSKRASAWFESEGLIEEALDQALEAGDLNLAAEIVSRHRIDDLEFRPFFVVERWLDRLPRELHDSRLDLLSTRLFILSQKFHFQEMLPLIDKAELLIADGSADKSQTAEVQMYRGLVEFILRSDAESAMRHFEAARASGALTHSELNSKLDYWSSISRVMLGEGEHAVKLLGASLGPLRYSKLQTATPRIAQLAIVRLLAGDLSGALLDAERVVEFRAKVCPWVLWSFYVRANVQFQTFHLEEAALCQPTNHDRFAGGVGSHLSVPETIR